MKWLDKLKRKRFINKSWKYAIKYAIKHCTLFETDYVCLQCLDEGYCEYKRLKGVDDDGN